MNQEQCRSIDIGYAVSVWSCGPEASVKSLGLSTLALVTMNDVVFNTILRALPLEALDLISVGNEDEFELGMARVPDDVFAEVYALTYGVDAVEFLDQPKEDRRAYLDAYSDISFDAVQALTQHQLNEFFEHMADGDDRRVALARAMKAPTAN